MSDEEEEDYMSDAFLAKCADTRPGLVSGRVARQHQQERKEKEANAKSKTKPKKVLEHEQREEGLSAALKEDNKGFALLSKMGYKPGMAIGRDGSGRKEPVPIEVKVSRTGLGHDADRKRKQQEVAAMRAQLQYKRQKMMSSLQGEFRHLHRNKQRQREFERDLGKSQRACFQLDQAQGWTEPTEAYFWPSTVMDDLAAKSQTESETDPTTSTKLEQGYAACVQEEEEEEDGEGEEDTEEALTSLTTEDKLEVLTEYLRSTYFYCIWCGTQYDDAEDMTSHCPGNTASDHDE